MSGIKTDLSALNQLQRDAVVSEELRLLVLAGAGSGKTKTLLQKIIYLIEEKRINPSEILAITFTKNAANEMIDRLIMVADTDGKYEAVISDKYKNKNEKESARLSFLRKYKWINSLTLKTFHSLCYSILRNYGVNEFDNKFKIIGEEKSNEDDELSKYIASETSFDVFHKITIELCENNQYLLDLKRYILDYIVDKIHIDKQQNGNFKKDGKYYTTLDGTMVRSKSEQYIADWLYRHSISYEYEPLLNIKDFNFRPDFYIKDANLYIEHISDKSYPTKDKEEQFEKGNLLLVKTHESLANDTALFNHYLDKIIKNRLPENFHTNVSLSFKEEFNHYHVEVKEFIRQVMRITDMIKVENTDIEEIQKKSQEDPHERVRAFYKVALPIVKRYHEYCINKSYLDFNDLITRTISLFNNHPDILNVFQTRYKYVLVDEFQDVNNLQVELIKKLITPTTQLFCVGDDWQSIYGFRGSNVNYIVEFEKHFKNPTIIKLNLNYRSTQHIVGASNEVIKHNKFKVEKDITASKKSEQKIVVFTGDNIEKNISFCIEKISELLEDGVKNDDILFLYRRSKMFNNPSNPIESYYHRLKEEGIKVQSKTIHASKGLEANVVFIIGLTEGHGGFPDIWLEDRIFQVIKPVNHDQLMEEERRLFYVALTRAKDKLFLITERGNESRFLKEIPENYTVRTSIPLKSAVLPVLLCKVCNSQLETLWKVCPYCGTQV